MRKRMLFVLAHSILMLNFLLSVSVWKCVCLFLIRFLDFFIAGHGDQSSRNSSHTATSACTSFGYSMYTAASHEDKVWTSSLLDMTTNQVETAHILLHPLVLLLDIRCTLLLYTVHSHEDVDEPMFLATVCVTQTLEQSRKTWKLIEPRSPSCVILATCHFQVDHRPHIF